MSDEAAAEQRLLHDVEQFGWHVIAVTDDLPSAFVYTVGLMQTFAHPELVLFGLPVETMHSVLISAVRLIEAGRRLEQGLHADVLESYAVATRSVHTSWHSRYLGFAMWHRRHVGHPGSLEAVQIFWPDRDGRLPWDEKCFPAVAGAQPRLDLPMLGHTEADS